MFWMTCLLFKALSDFAHHYNDLGTLTKLPYSQSLVIRAEIDYIIHIMKVKIETEKKII